MFSHVRRLRSTAMAIIAIASLAWAVSSQALSIKFSITLSGGGILSGSVTGDDTDGNKKLEVLDTNIPLDGDNDRIELTVLTAQWKPVSGSGDPAGFSFSLSTPADFSLANFVAFQYDIPTKTIEQLLLVTQSGDRGISYPEIGPIDNTPCTESRCIVISGPITQDNPGSVSSNLGKFPGDSGDSEQGPGPEPVPEPGTIALFGFGLVSMSGYAFARRRYASKTH